MTADVTAALERLTELVGAHPGCATWAGPNPCNCGSDEAEADLALVAQALAEREIEAAAQQFCLTEAEASATNAARRIVEIVAAHKVALADARRQAVEEAVQVAERVADVYARAMEKWRASGEDLQARIESDCEDAALEVAEEIRALLPPEPRREP